MNEDNNKSETEHGNELFEQEKAILLDHNYDGIEELDNPLPNWWLMTFYGAVVYSIFYVGYYHFLGGPSLDQELATEMAFIEEQKQMEGGSEQQELTNEDFNLLLTDVEVLELGKSQYQMKCAACHAIDGGGSIGPNLTDKYWIHGDGSMPAINAVIAEGVLEKGMPAWSAVMSEEEIRATTVYIKTLFGSNPSNPKAPQGEVISDI